MMAIKHLLAFFNMRPSILSTKGVTSDMRFYCRDCDYTYCGDEVLNGSLDMFIIHKDEKNPINSTFRCHLCQEDVDDSYN
jgi:transposase-like protein